MPVSTIFQLYRGGQWMKSEYPEKITDSTQGIDKPFHIMLYRVHLLNDKNDLPKIYLYTKYLAESDFVVIVNCLMLCFA